LGASEDEWMLWLLLISAEVKRGRLNICLAMNNGIYKLQTSLT